MKKKYVIAVDLGGTKIACALTDLEGNIINENTIPTNAQEGEQEVLKRMFLVIEKVLEDSKKNSDEIKAIGIGSPGPLDSDKGIILDPPNLPLKNVDIVKYIEDRFKIKTYLENDANAAAIGEYLFGAGKETRNMVYITVSTGIGAGAIIDGKIYRGATCNALELGHVTILPDGPRCNCGNFGCLEVLASGTAIAREANKNLAHGIESSLNNYKKITSYEVFKEASLGDKMSLEVVNKALGYLGIGIANAITAFDPQKVIIGGGVAMAGDMLFDKVRKVVKERCFKVLNESCEIVQASLKTKSGIIGAAAVAITESK
ncbi:ROK family protein [Clostridium sp. P21]|uniref:ROK family protein n=1 Tax=Clostridium muellerianum TaxID=2716538 RepID=A0A7Y0ELQ5_9CLOT|nr:ROK family protein [Clostridium muellerianum]NMM65771.1 ROK family protein [Clostridium muellerianum]